MFRTTCQPQTLVCNSRFRTWRFQLSFIWKIQSNRPAGGRPGSGENGLKGKNLLQFMTSPKKIASQNLTNF